MNRKTVIAILIFFEIFLTIFIPGSSLAVYVLRPQSQIDFYQSHSASNTAKFNIKSGLSIPYEGLVLAWQSNSGLYYGGQLQAQQNETWIYLYSARARRRVDFFYLLKKTTGKQSPLIFQQIPLYFPEQLP